MAVTSMSPLPDMTTVSELPPLAARTPFVYHAVTGRP